MAETNIRSMQADDWIPVLSDLTGADDKPLAGYARADGRGGNPLLCALPGEAAYESQLTDIYAALRVSYPGLIAARYHVRMPYWDGPRVPSSEDYVFVDTPHALGTTAITVLLVPDRLIAQATLGYHFRDAVLPSLRDRLKGTSFQGLVGNLGYFMTPALIKGKFRWSHNIRYPDHPLPETAAYIGFHWQRHGTGERAIEGTFEGAHPSTVAIRVDGGVDILHDLAIESYIVFLGQQKVMVDAINVHHMDETADAVHVNSDVIVFTPALRTPEIERLTNAAVRSHGSDTSWRSFAPTIPLSDASERIHVFIANLGDGHMPRERVVAVWEGQAPLPSFGAVLSFRRSCFASLFGSAETFAASYSGQPVQIVPVTKRNLSTYQAMLGGLVPAVVGGHHLCYAETVSDVLRNLCRWGNALSPFAETGRETRNFDPYVREPIGLLLQTQSHTGWVLLDGRHELSIGASVVDAAVLLKKLEHAGCLAGETVQDAVFVDGGSAMKLYYVIRRGESDVRLMALNRAAAGARSGPGLDSEGLNLYSTLAVGCPGSGSRSCAGQKTDP